VHLRTAIAGAGITLVLVDEIEAATISPEMRLGFRTVPGS